MTDNKTTIQRATTFDFQFTIENTDFEAEGYSLYFMIKKSKEDTDAKALVSKNAEIDSETKIATISLTPSDTDLEPGDYWFASRVHKDADNSYPFIEDVLKVDPAGVGLPDSGSGL